MTTSFTTARRLGSDWEMPADATDKRPGETFTLKNTLTGQEIEVVVKRNE
jgi:hypothetical protein